MAHPFRPVEVGQTLEMRYTGGVTLTDMILVPEWALPGRDLDTKWAFSRSICPTGIGEAPDLTQIECLGVRTRCTNKCHTCRSETVEESQSRSSSGPGETNAVDRFLGGIIRDVAARPPEYSVYQLCSHDMLDCLTSTSTTVLESEFVAGKVI